MYSSSDDTFRELVEETDDDYLLSLVAFAIVEDRRVDWKKHFEEGHGREPTTEEVRNWYEQQPVGALRRAKAEAEEKLREFSNEVVATLEEEIGAEIEEEVIVREIRFVGGFWRQFRVNFSASLASAVVLALLLGLVAYMVFSDITPVDIGKGIVEQSEVGENGKE